MAGFHGLQAIEKVNSGVQLGWLSRGRGGVDVAVDTNEPVVAVRTVPLHFLTQVDLRARRAIEAPRLATLRTVVVEF